MGSCCVEAVNNTRTLNLIWALIASNSPIIYLCPWRGLELSFRKCYVVYVLEFMLLEPNHEKLGGLTSFHYMFIKQLSSIEFSKSKVDIDIDKFQNNLFKK